jgi:hypothetical protein
VQHPVYPGAAVAPSRAHERGPEIVRVAHGIPGPFLARAPGPFLARLAAPLLARNPGLLGIPAALLLSLPALALLGPLALHLGLPALQVCLPALLLGLRPLRVRRFAVSIRHAASRSRWSP